MCVRAYMHACVRACLCACVSVYVYSPKCVDSLAGLPRNACILLGIYTALRPSGWAASAASTNGCGVASPCFGRNMGQGS